jgi:hypothetical protein
VTSMARTRIAGIFMKLAPGKDRGEFVVTHNMPRFPTPDVRVVVMKAAAHISADGPLVRSRLRLAEAAALCERIHTNVRRRVDVTWVDVTRASLLLV